MDTVFPRGTLAKRPFRVEGNRAFGPGIADDKGGTDAAFAALSGKPAVVESFGLAGYGYHSSDEEYVELDSIEPRLYLLVRLIMDLAAGR